MTKFETFLKKNNLHNKRIVCHLGTISSGHFITNIIKSARYINNNYIVVIAGTVRNGYDVRLNELIKRKGRVFNYIYDFGDLWNHEICVESTYNKHTLDLDIFCIGGERACPPEEVGGVDGYYHFLEVINNPGHADWEQYMTWADNCYDSEYYDEKIINWLLIKYYIWSRDRYLDWSEENDEYNDT